MINIQSEVLDWLLSGDPAVRWQALRDLCGEAPERVDQEQARVAVEGWGAQLLAHQEPGGGWGGGMYSPKWISTHYTLLTLRQLGLPPGNPQALKGCALALERGFFNDGGINYFAQRKHSSHAKHSETCITGMALGFLAYFGVHDDRLEAIADHLLRQQMADGGWNCQSYQGDTHASFHTTLLVLEGLEEYRRRLPRPAASEAAQIEAAQRGGEEFLLEHQLFCSHRSGQVFDPRMLRFPFPPRWRYDVLSCLDYFQYSWRRRGLRGDERMRPAVEHIAGKRQPDGRWKQASTMSGRIYFEMEHAGEPGRWNTLRALRVLRWWEEAA
jgi:hypothetical protein